jgi:hypothetical protein
MPISHPSANVCCIHDEDDKREVRLEMRRWLESEASEQSPANQRSRKETDDSPGAVSRTTYSAIGIERLLHRRIPVSHAISHACGARECVYV